MNIKEGIRRRPPKTVSSERRLFLTGRELGNTVSRQNSVVVESLLTFHPKGERRAAFAIIEIQKIALNSAAEIRGAFVIVSGEAIALDIQCDVMTVGIVQRKPGAAALAGKTATALLISDFEMVRRNRCGHGDVLRLGAVEYPR